MAPAADRRHVRGVIVEVEGARVLMWRAVPYCTYLKGIVFPRTKGLPKAIPLGRCDKRFEPTYFPRIWQLINLWVGRKREQLRV